MRNRRAWRHTGTQHSSCVQLSPDHHHLLLFLVSCVDCAPAQHSGVPLHGTDLSAAYISHRLRHYASQQHGGMLQARARAGVNSRPSPSPYVGVQWWRHILYIKTTRWPIHDQSLRLLAVPSSWRWKKLSAHPSISSSSSGDLHRVTFTWINLGHAAGWSRCICWVFIVHLPHHDLLPPQQYYPPPPNISSQP